MDKHVVHNNPLMADDENRKPSVTITIKIPFLVGDDSDEF